MNECFSTHLRAPGWWHAAYQQRREDSEVSDFKNCNLFCFHHQKFVGFWAVCFMLTKLLLLFTALQMYGVLWISKLSVWPTHCLGADPWFRYRIFTGLFPSFIHRQSPMHWEAVHCHCRQHSVRPTDGHISYQFSLAPSHRILVPAQAHGSTSYIYIYIYTVS